MENSKQCNFQNTGANLFGVGLRFEHFGHLEDKLKSKTLETENNYFEIITENHMDSKGRPLEILKALRENYEISFHGVSLNIANYDSLDYSYLRKLKSFINEIKPFHVSDHLCWTGLKENNLHNLLPFPYTEENLKFLIGKVKEVQEILETKISLENLSAYFDFHSATMKEWEFLSSLASEADCNLLLDVNNIYVNSKNHQYDPLEFIDHIDLDKVGEIHLAGFSDMGDFLFDTHSNPVHQDVWKLYEYVVAKKSNIPTLVEWDDDIPDFKTLESELVKAINISKQLHS